MKNFKQIAKEMREKLEKAICVGPIGTMDGRLNELLNDFETSIASYADDEAIRRAKIYVDNFKEAKNGVNETED